MEAKKRELIERIEGYPLQKSQLEDALAASEKQLKRLEDRLLALVSANPWIREHASYGFDGRYPTNNITWYREFDKIGGQFDFSQYNMSEIASKAKSLEAHREGLRRTINFNVIDMLDRVEAKENSLRQMLSTVKKDRGKIEGTIVKLNEYMLDALNRTWKKVSTYYRVLAFTCD